MSQLALSDPGPAVIYARKTLESGVKWAFAHDNQLPQPYEDALNAYINEPVFKDLAEGRVYRVAKKIQIAGNKAVHESKPPSQLEAVEVISALFQFCFWLAFTYGRAQKPDVKAWFDPNTLPKSPIPEAAPSLKERQELDERLKQDAEEAEVAKERAALLSQSVEELEAKRAALIAEVAMAKKRTEAIPVEAHDWSERATRDYKIDHLLKESGWRLRDSRDREFKVHGMPSDSGIGYVDYVLWGDDGKPLALVEAKRSRVSPRSGQQQAKLYADSLEQETGQRPIIFYSNGYEHWLWDDTQNIPRPVQGFLTKDELQLTIQRRTSRHLLSGIELNTQIVERYYQHRAIRSIAERFDVEKQRKALLVMATGAGKTRTVIALSDLLMRANAVKRVLFLADRTALVNQAVNAFKTHLPDSSPVNLVTEGKSDGRVYLSTYQTMIGKIDEIMPDGTRRFGPGYFDLVVIDEAHRSVYRKYKGIFEYLDSYLVGLTATPKGEVDKNTYELFDLETGVPTDAYSLEDAIADKFLVPPRTVSVPVKFLRDGVRYDELSEEEKTDWDEFDWGEDEYGNPLDPPKEVDAAKLNKWLFNEDTVDKVLETLMTEGIKVAGGDRVGKSIIFAKNRDHADFIYDRFCANYPHLDNGDFAKVITHGTKYVQSLIDAFSDKEKAPHIAISVDMLDTGIDVPECVNLVFFKRVRSKTKFWQMIGRGTRLSPDLFGPSDDKVGFYVFDFCQNLEYFSQEMLPAEHSGGLPLSEQIFKARLELIQTFNNIHSYGDERAEVAGILRDTIASMNEQNFLVRPHLELVEKYRKSQPWESLSVGDLAALADRVASLPDQLEPDKEESKRFDMLVMNAQLGALRGEPFERQRKQVMQIAGALEDQQAIPVIKQQLNLILDIQNDEWWVNVSYPMLEEVRKKLRALVPLIERSRKKVIYSNFEDELGDCVDIELPGTGGLLSSNEFAQFRKKAEHFLKQHLDEPSIVKVRSGDPLLPVDVENLQLILAKNGIGDTEAFAVASEQSGGFGLFVRSIVGMDRAAAKRAFADFLDENRYSKNQIQFINFVVDELTDQGVVAPKRMYEAPYDGVAPQGPDDIFVPSDFNRILEVVEELRSAAAA